MLPTVAMSALVSYAYHLHTEEPSETRRAGRQGIQGGAHLKLNRRRPRRLENV